MTADPMELADLLDDLIDIAHELGCDPDMPSMMRAIGDLKSGRDWAIRAAVEAERARWIKAATDVARDATAAGNEHAAAGALAVSMLTPTTEATHG